ncbi:5772_t:CDS:2, partial [Rhizophagus irregularis]
MPNTLQNHSEVEPSISQIFANKCNYHCIDENKATLFRLFEVPKEKEQLIVNADHAVQTYWTHIHNDFNHAPPKFKGFNYESQDSGTQPFTQHFGIFRSNNKFVYQSQDYMCKVKNDEYFNHSCCVDKMLYEINEVADYIANIMEFYYPSMYRNLSNLCFPPQVKKLFKVFGMCAVNFNTICGCHIDRDDDKYGFCWLVPLGEWKGGDLIFPQLNIRIKLKPGNILAFRSNLLVHGNLPCSVGATNDQSSPSRSRAYTWLMIELYTLPSSPRDQKERFKGSNQRNLQKKNPRTEATYKKKRKKIKSEQNEEFYRIKKKFERKKPTKKEILNRKDPTQKLNNTTNTLSTLPIQYENRIVCVLGFEWSIMQV